MVRTLIALVALPVALLASGCGGPPAPSGSASDATQPDATAALTLAQRAAFLERVLDPASRDLLTVIEPDEDIEATLTVARAARVADLATSRGLRSQLFAADTVNVSGPVAAVLAFALEVGPSEVNVDQDHRPDRWLPATMPAVTVPTPGSPYLHAPLPVDRSGLQMSADQQVVLLQALAASIVTIDGAPYDRIDVTGGCSGRPPSCSVAAEGFRTIAGGVSDSYGIISDPTTNGVPRLDTMIAGGVPRALARDAEWIARNDASGAAAISAYRVCCYAAWDPARPGRIAITWTRQCLAGAAPAGALVAETGDCTDTLRIVVDLATATVVSIARQAAH
jgi:hypothetical protein